MSGRCGRNGGMCENGEGVNEKINMERNWDVKTSAGKGGKKMRRWYTVYLQNGRRFFWLSGNPELRICVQKQEDGKIVAVYCIPLT